MRKGIPGFRLILLLSCLMLGGCLKLEQTDESRHVPSENSAVEKTSWSTVRLFYGTDRRRTGEENWNRYYGVQQGQLEYGCCEVSIPDTHQYGEIERPQIWKLEFQETPDRHIMLQEIQPQSREDFLATLQADVARSSQSEAFVFVHGYNVSFAEAAHRTAQMAYDLKFPGPPILFSWPSQGELAGYVADMTAADQARDSLRQFLETVALDSGAQRVHLIAHSMGNRVVTEVLRRFTEQAPVRPVPRFSQIVLAAPDVDAQTFKQEIAPRLSAAGERVTIYASANDRALQASRLVHRSPRLGQGGEQITTFPEQPVIEVVDASWVDFRFFDLGHAEYGDALLADVKQTLAGFPAPERGLQPHQFPQAWTVPAEVPLLAVREQIQNIKHEQPAGRSHVKLQPPSSSPSAGFSSPWKRWWQSLFAFGSPHKQ